MSTNNNKIDSEHNDCIFCKIANKEIPSEFLYEDENVIAIKDIHPFAPIHILVITKSHIPSIMAVDDTNIGILKNVVKAVQELAKKYGIAEDGFRVINNCGKKGGQSVNHIHFHLLGGRDMQWPPG